MEYKFIPNKNITDSPKRYVVFNSTVIGKVHFLSVDFCFKTTKLLAGIRRQTMD